VAQIDFFRSDVRDEIENISFFLPVCAGGGKGAGCQQAVNVDARLMKESIFTVRSTPISPLHSMQIRA
jgi:hypothetical protein